MLKVIAYQRKRCSIENLISFKHIGKSNCQETTPGDKMEKMTMQFTLSKIAEYFIIFVSIHFFILKEPHRLRVIKQT